MTTNGFDDRFIFRCFFSARFSKFLKDFFNFKLGFNEVLLAYSLHCFLLAILFIAASSLCSMEIALAKSSSKSYF
ncbi:unnamed protein product [Moneuplotes crassus]|uniref:Uncharacterized protein n=1 Tax=Euplotes crassus TaxID=5936 RepID=A0AAD1XU28_EUPCR|nr:unnamed protein product [Moneuplotes crassus]